MSAAANNSMGRYLAIAVLPVLLVAGFGLFGSNPVGMVASAQEAQPEKPGDTTAKPGEPTAKPGDSNAKPGDSAAKKEGDGGLFGGGGGMLVPMVLIMAVFFFLIILPAQRREKKQREMITTNLKKNDEVITSAGIIGIVQNIKENGDEVTLKIDDNGARIRVLKSSIARIVTKEVPKDAAATPPAANTDAKPT